jgi:hypothetical protein
MSAFAPAVAPSGHSICDFGFDLREAEAVDVARKPDREASSG